MLDHEVLSTKFKYANLRKKSVGDKIYLVVIFSIIGPPGSGKTTQANILGERFEIPVLHMGDILRTFLSSKSLIARKIKQAMTRGEMVPGSIGKRIIVKWIKKYKNTKGFILDGFPRRLKDARLFHDQILHQVNVSQLPYLGVINIDIPLEIALERVLTRSKFGCERPDENEKVTRSRYKIYLEQKPKLREFYAKMGRWFEVDGKQNVSTIQKQIERLVEEQDSFLNLQTVLILGAPGSGKDTQAQKLQIFGYESFSSGEAFRKEIAKGSKIGLLIRDRYINTGKLVPDRYHKDVIYRRLAEFINNRKKVVLTGVVRTVRQAQRLDEYLAHFGGVIKHVILLRVRKKELIERLSLRRVCPKCGFNYHLKFLPPKKDGICDKDGTKLIRRVDEDPTVVKTRLQVQFYDVIKPLITYYRKTNRLYIVDGNSTPEEVFKNVRSVLKL